MQERGQLDALGRDDADVLLGRPPQMPPAQAALASFFTLLGGELLLLF